MRKHARARRPSSPLSRALRSRCRPKPTSRARSARISTTDAIFAARQACGRRSAARSSRAAGDLRQRSPRVRPIRPTPPAPARARLRNACLDLLAVTGEPAAIALAAKQYRRRRQHDRPSGGACRRCRSTTCRNAQQALDGFLQALRERCAGDRQVVHDAGRDPRSGYARSRARPADTSRILAVAIPIACAR